MNNDFINGFGMVVVGGDEIVGRITEYKDGTIGVESKDVLALFTAQQVEEIMFLPGIV